MTDITMALRTACGHDSRSVDGCTNCEAADEIERLRAAFAASMSARVDIVAALQWYADGLHFEKASPDAWDTVSGEPQNWQCDECGTATVEDGSIAAMTLRGELTAAQIQALD